MAITFPVIEVKVLGTGPAGEAILNVLHYQASEAVTISPINLQTFAANFIAGVLNPLTACLTNDWDGSQLTVRTLQNNGTANIEYEESLVGTTGGIAAVSAPLCNCVLLQKKTGYVGRHARGRMYISPVPDTYFDADGTLDQAAAGAGGFGALIPALLATITALAIWTLVVCDVPGLTNAYAVSDVQYNPVLGLQRSRRIRIPN